MTQLAGHEQLISQPKGDGKRSVRLELLGRRFTVRSDDDETYIGGLVDFVSEKLNEMRKASGRVEVDHIALMTLLDVADTLFRERENLQEMRDQLERSQREVAKLAKDNRALADREKELKRQVKERSDHLLKAIDKMAEKIGAAEATVGAKASPAQAKLL